MKRIFILMALAGTLLIAACPRETSLSAGDKAVNLSKQDLAGRVNVPADEISVLSVKENVPAASFPTATGYVVVLEAKGSEYEYYAGGGSVVLWETGLARHPESTKNTSKPALTTATAGSPAEGFYVPVETTGLMDGKPWMPVN
jgi:hypothetical protein